MTANKSKKGLASASAETRKRVGSLGCKAPHALRGLQGASKETRIRVAKMGGKASYKFGKS